jgi:hypothetical protein
MALLSRAQLNRVPIGAGFGTKTARAILREEDAALDTYDVFLSHSYADAKKLSDDDLLRIKRLLEGFDLKVYVDWEDPSLSRENVSPKTAAILRARMSSSKSLLYATSTNASKSKWMPWELGYFDGHRGRVAILPIEESSGSKSTFDGQEYLGLYPYVTYGPSNSGGDSFWVEEKDGKYVALKLWINGSNPAKY